MSNWRVADAELRRIAARRADLDAEEAEWLVIARRANAHRELGCASFLEYMEQVCGYEPRTAQERLRVAEALADLPATRAAWRAGRLNFSATRELVRVAAPETEAAWLDAAAEKSVREIEQLVSGRRRGDRPDSPRQRDVQPRVLRFEVAPDTFALLREARRAIEERRG